MISSRSIMPISCAVTVTFLTKLEEGVVKSFITMAGLSSGIALSVRPQRSVRIFGIEAMMEAVSYRRNQQIRVVSFRNRRTPAFKIEHCASNTFAPMIPLAKIVPFIA
jgi:hypothetical protein